MQALTQTDKSKWLALKTQPSNYYNNLPYRKVEDAPFDTTTPTLAEITKEMGDGTTKALLIIAISEVVKFLNVGKTMDAMQVGMTAELIYDKFWWLKLQEIKHVFRDGLSRDKLFDRLDGNILLNWLKEYDEKRTERIILSNDNEDKLSQNRITPVGKNDVTLKEYRKHLQALADSGDAIALAKLKEQDGMIAMGLFPKHLLEE